MLFKNHVFKKSSKIIALFTGLFFLGLNFFLFIISVESWMIKHKGLIWVLGRHPFFTSYALISLIIALFWFYIALRREPKPKKKYRELREFF